MFLNKVLGNFLNSSLSRNTNIDSFIENYEIFWTNQKPLLQSTRFLLVKNLGFFSSKLVLFGFLFVFVCLFLKKNSQKNISIITLSLARFCLVLVINDLTLKSVLFFLQNILLFNYHAHTMHTLLSPLFRYLILSCACIVFFLSPTLCL